MLKIYIARHGQNEDNAKGILNGRRDLPLTELGRTQANQLAEGMKDLGLIFDKVYSSPLSRAYETAEIVSEKLGLPKPEILENLIERDFGIMTGKFETDILKYCSSDILKSKTITYFLSPEGAERFPALLERGKKVLEKIKEGHNDGSVLLVTHGDMGKMIYAAYYDLTWENILTMFHFGNSELLQLNQDSGAEDLHVIRVEQHNN